MAIGDQSDMLSRLKSYLPRWFGDSSPFIDGVMTGFAYVASFIFSLYQYAANQTRIKTATDGFLDMIAADFFGTTIARVVGQADGSFRAKIIANMFRERGTRYGMTKMLLDVTGRQASCVEPGNPGQVGAYNTPLIDTRNSPGTYYDNNGILQTAPANMPRYSFNPANLAAGPALLIEGAATNVLSYSTQFDKALWIKTGCTITPNATTAPDGTLTADKLVEDTSTGGHEINQTSNVGGVSGNFMTGSVYLKAAERTRAFLRIYQASNIYALIDVNLATGQITYTGAPNTQSLTSSIQSVGNGWYRVSVSATSTNTSLWQLHVQAANSTVSSVYPMGSYAGDGASGLYAWGAQLESGNVPTSFIQTAANQLLYPSDYTQGLWTKKTGVVITPAATTDPNGANGAQSIYLPPGSSQVYQLSVFTVPTGAAYTLSVWLRADTPCNVNIGINGRSAGANNQGTAVNVTTAWQRFSYTLASATADSGLYGIIASMNATGTGSSTLAGSATVYAWGAQLEAGSIPTAYTPSTRAPDVVSQSNEGAVAGYGMAGAWGTVQYPGIVLITAYLPNGSNGVAAGSLTAQDIYNAVEAVRPIGSTCWVSVQS